jgi:glycosyltransferase involved in cell wall biosynthesis
VNPRVVIAAPVFNKAGYLEAAVRSLLAQTYGDLAVLIIDDRSTDDTVAVARRLAAEDPRVEVYVNTERLGMLGNTNRALTLARKRFPRAEYWALGSDHDIWGPNWLEALTGLLDAHPEAVLAYPLAERIDENGVPYNGSKVPKAFDTLGVDDRWDRLEAAFRGMSAGNMIYGLFRLQALDGPLYRPVLVPDRLLLSELSLRGSFAVAPEILWHRRFRGLAELDRQRRAFFLDGIPRHAHMPWWAQHALALAWAYVLRGEGAAAGIGRLGGLALTARYLRLALGLRGRRRWARVRRRGRHIRRRLRPRRIAHHIVVGILERHGEATGIRARRSLTALQRFPLTRGVVNGRLAPAFERFADRLSRRDEQ